MGTPLVRAPRWTDRAGPGVLATLAPAAVLVVDPWGWYPFGPAKWLSVSVLGFAGTALVLRDRPPRVERGLLVALAALIGCMALAAAVGEDPTYAWIGTPERHFGVVTWVLCAALLVAGTSLAPARGRTGEPGSGADDHPLSLLVGLVAGGLALGAVATLEALGWEPEVFDVGGRLTATLGSAAYLGAAAALLLPAVIGVAADAGLERRLRRSAAVAAPLLLVAVAGSGARAAWAGLAASLVVVAWPRRAWVRGHAQVALIGAASAVVVLAGALLLSPMGDRLASLSDADAPGGRGRFDEWVTASRVLVDHPVTGVGPEGYRITFHEGVDAAYERQHGRQQQPDRAHSGPLDVALAGGGPGLLAWLAVGVLAGRSVLRSVGRGRPWRVGIGAALVAHVTGQLFLFPLAELEPVAWLLAGALVGSDPDLRLRQSPRPVPRALPVLLAAVATFALVAGGSDVVADRRAERAADALERGDHRAAAIHAESAVAMRPDVVRLHVLAAVARVADDQGIQAGIAQLDDALDISPGDPIVLRARVALLVDRAAATQVPAHLSAASREVERLLADDPVSAALWAQAERVALLEGDAPAAAEARRRWRELTPPEGRPDEADR